MLMFREVTFIFPHFSHQSIVDQIDSNLKEYQLVQSLIIE